MAIQNINGAAAAAAQTAPTKAGGQITRDDFMKLLIAQLQNQDPLSPMDNQEFAVQLATFNSLEQLVGLNEKLESLASQQGLASQFNSAALIGKRVVGKGNEVNLGASGDTSLHYELGTNAAKVTVKVLNSSGVVVRQIDAGSQKTGAQSATWDGNNTLGQRLPPGVYSFEVTAADGTGGALPVIKQVRGLVTGVNLEGPEPILEIGQLRISLSALTAIH
ncbi:MAG: flagellar hook assembly protein FlgD [Candidatus Binatia bacterium]